MNFIKKMREGAAKARAIADKQLDETKEQARLNAERRRKERQAMGLNNTFIKY